MKMETNPQIVVVNAGSLSDEDLERLRKAGYIVVSSLDNNVDCLRIVSGVSLPIDPLCIVNAAFWAVGLSGYTTGEFGKRVQALCEKATKS